VGLLGAHRPWQAQMIELHLSPPDFVAKVPDEHSK
jgi:hypothetical protein